MRPGKGEANTCSLICVLEMGLLDACLWSDIVHLVTRLMLTSLPNPSPMDGHVREMV